MSFSEGLSPVLNTGPILALPNAGCHVADAFIKWRDGVYFGQRSAQLLMLQCRQMCRVVFVDVAQSKLIRPLARCNTSLGSDDKHHVVSVSRQDSTSNLERRLTDLIMTLNLLENIATLTVFGHEAQGGSCTSTCNTTYL